MLQVQPNLVVEFRHTSDLEERLPKVAVIPNFRFEGPGLYLYHNQCLIIQASLKTTLDRKGTWLHKRHWDLLKTKWIAYIWNCPFRETILRDVACMPVRQDMS